MIPHSIKDTNEFGVELKKLGYNLRLLDKVRGKSNAFVNPKPIRSFVCDILSAAKPYVRFL
jgi:hypothetical protein